jgi:hypothetical protein
MVDFHCSLWHVRGTCNYDSTNGGSGAVNVYVAKDYSGNISFSYRIPRPEKDYGHSAVKRRITKLIFSPDGYALFVASEVGWQLRSVYGHLLSSNYLLDRSGPESVDINEDSPLEAYMNGIRDCCWTWSGLSLIVLATENRCFYSLPFSRNAVTTCFNPVKHGFHFSHILGYHSSARSTR